MPSDPISMLEDQLNECHRLLAELPCENERLREEVETLEEENRQLRMALNHATRTDQAR